MNDSDYDPIQSRLVSVEQKVNLLLVAAAIQVVTVLLSWVHFLYQSMSVSYTHLTLPTIYSV